MSVLLKKPQTGLPLVSSNRNLLFNLAELCKVRCGLKVFPGNKVGKNYICIHMSDALDFMGRENKNIHEWKNGKYN